VEKTFAKVEEMAETMKTYFNTRLDRIKLSAAEKSSGVLANLIAAFLVLIVFLFFIVFASISLAIGLGFWIGSMWAGFLIVAGVYLFLGIIVWAAKQKIIRLPIMNAIIQQLFTNDEEDQE
jgi:hypothetical protein